MVDRQEQHLAFVMGAISALAKVVSISLLGASMNRNVGEKMLEELLQCRENGLKEVDMTPDDFNKVATISHNQILDEMIEKLRERLQ